MKIKNKQIKDISKQKLKSFSVFSTPYQGGQAMMVLVVLFLFISLAVMFGLVNPTLTEAKIARSLALSSQSYFLSEGAVEDVLLRIKRGKQYSNPEIFTLAGASATVSVSTVGSGQKEVVAMADASQNIRSVSVLIQTGTGVDFPFGAQVGAGGLTMSQNSRVEGAGGTTGNVYSNGPVTGATGATVTGSLTVAADLSEDNQAQSTVCNQDQISGQTDPQIDFAQSFRPTDSGSLYKVSLYIKKTSGANPPSTTVRIVSDSAGSPGTSSLASESFSASLVTTDYGWVDVAFSAPATLVGGDTYWIVFDAGRNSSRYWTWCKDSNNGFGNGVGKYKQDWDNGGAWTQITGDLTFKTYFGAGPGIIDAVNVSGNAYANTITSSTITGTAYCQNGSGNNKACDTSQPDPSPLNMPISQGNIDQWKIDADPDSSPRNGNLDVTTDLSYGPEKIIGDLNLITNNKTLTVTGTLYVTGNVDIGNGASVRCGSSYGSDSCLIVTDGWVHVENNGTFAGSGQAGSYVMLLTTIEGCNGSGSECTHHGAGLDLHNQATGAIFYASNSMAHLHNGVQVSAITAYKLELENTAVIRYEIGIANTNFSGGPGGGWNVDSWVEIE